MGEKSLDNLPLIRAILSTRATPRLRHGHPWVFRTEIAGLNQREARAVEDGETRRVIHGPPQPARAEVRDRAGRFVGRGLWSPLSAIAVRLLTRNPDEDLSERLIVDRTRAALALRSPLLADQESETSACRLVFAEGDGLPGLIVDKFGPALVFQSLALGAEAFRDAVINELVRSLAPRYVIERNDVPVRALEGLPERKGLWPGSGPLAGSGQVTIVENGAPMLIDLLEGQKTGYYLDQRDNRAAVGRLARTLGNVACGRNIDVLDCFSYSGGFAVAAALGAGSKLGRLVCVDASEGALSLAAANLELNGFGGRAEMRTANAFDELRRMDREAPGERFDLIILDPPPFARERRMIEGALRGYKEINLRAMKLLRPGGFLVTCTCSHHLDRESFLAVLTEAAADAGATMQLTEVRGQPLDHPVLLGYPEGDYLKCYVLHKAPRR